MKRAIVASTILAAGVLSAAFTAHAGDSVKSKSPKFVALPANFVWLPSFLTEKGDKAEHRQVAFTQVQSNGGPAFFGAEPTQFEPTPIELPPMPGGSVTTEPPTVVENVQVIELYPHVRYKDLDNVHPRGVPTIVAVKDPGCCDKKCECSEPGCVYVEICVPPCGEPKFDVKRSDGSKVEYDYGDYEIEITSKKGVVTVDYDD